MGAVVMPRKNNLIIYDAVYRSAVLEFGLWNQVRVDHGKEFYLTLYVHKKLRVGRGDEHVAPYDQTTSTCNHVIERMWVELNHRVTYPVKRIMTSMEDQQSIDMSCPVTKFCVYCFVSMQNRNGQNGPGMERPSYSWTWYSKYTTDAKFSHFAHPPC